MSTIKYNDDLVVHLIDFNLMAVFFKYLNKNSCH